MKWAQLLAGVVVLVAAGAFLARPSGPRSVYSGGFDTHGRQCFYRVADGRLAYLIVLDGQWLQGTGRSTFGDWGCSFERPDGRTFQMHSRVRGALLIDGHEYRLADGALFLVTVEPTGNRCQQLTARFEGSNPHPNDEPHARDQLERAARDFPEVRAFLGRD